MPQCFIAALMGPASWAKDKALPVVVARHGAASTEGSFRRIRQALPPNCFSSGGGLPWEHREGGGHPAR